MKITSSIGFVAVIALTLFTVRAEAQIDSNAKVMIVCSPIGETCTMTVFHDAYFGTLDSVDSAPSRQGWGFALNDTFRYTDGPRFGVTLSVDTVNKCFRNLLFSSSNSYGAQGECAQAGGFGDGTSALDARLDSLAYEDSSGVLSAHGVQAMSYKLSSRYSCLAGHQSWNGACEVSGKQVDTISMRIIPNGYLSVPQPLPVSGMSSLAIRVQVMESALCTFPVSEYPSTLKIYDLLGRIAAVVSIPISTDYLELPTASLSPGCYFARLDNQVAKFVVPPR